VADALARAVFHTLVAALFVEALLRLWNLSHPGQRLGFRLLVLGVPLVLDPAFEWVMPWRGEPAIRETQALFAGVRWDDVRVAGTGLYAVWTGACAALGLVLLLLDLGPLVADLRRRRAARAHAPPGWTEPVEARVFRLAPKLGVAAPRVIALDKPGPLLHCAGVAHPVLVVSGGAMALLDEREREAAFAHELAHLRHRDPLAGWVLMAARVLMVFNPVFQVVARVAAREIEWRADDAAARATGDPLSVASALLRLYRAAHAAEPGRLVRLRRGPGPVVRARHRAVEARCRRLLDGVSGQPLPFPAARYVLTAATLGALLYRVV